VSDPILEARNLTKRFGSLLVTDDVSLRLAPGARHALIGPNGAGKSTLVHQFSGVVRPDAGRIFVSGNDVTALSAHRRVAYGLGRTFQVTNLFPALTVMHSLFLAVSERAGLSRTAWRPAAACKDALDDACAVAEMLRLSHCLPRRVSELAYGEQRLLEIAIAMALKPKILLLDEPAAGLPKSDIPLVLDAIRRLPAETAILLIEHDMLIVREFAQVVTVLVDGRVTISGPPQDVLASDIVRAVYLGNRHGKRHDANPCA
jgi:ABC-type branched-subunit amino acid transport system ATPase component